LFREFVAAALEYNAAERLPVDIPDEDSDGAGRRAAHLQNVREDVREAFDRPAS
jgi:hypothetical protein